LAADPLAKQFPDENQAVCVETLAVKNILKNHSLAGATADAAWHGLIAKLAYKAGRKGRHLVKIDRWIASSKTCSCYARVKVDLALKERRRSTG
jgi:putative transposase